MQDQAKALLESCQLDEALSLYDQLYQIASSSNSLNPDLLDDYAEALSSSGNIDYAKKLYQESIEKFPGQNTSKYFSLAQLSSGQTAANLYLTGISYSTNSDKSQIASAYAALAELFMTDLCDEPRAEEKCEEFINNAIKADELCIDAYLSLSNLRLVRNNIVEAKEALRKLRIVLENCGSENLPSSEFLIQVCKNCIECEDFEGLEFVSEVGISIDEENLELNYLRAFALAKIGSHDEARDVLQGLLKKELNAELKEACEEVLLSLS